MKKRFYVMCAFIGVILFCPVNVIKGYAQTGTASQKEEKIPVSTVLEEIITKEGVKAAIEKYRILRKNEPEKYDFSEMQLNNLGYRLIQNARVKDAVEIFKLNIEVYPEAVNPYDSMAEAYLMDGDLERSAEYYTKALKIDPDYASSITGLNKIYTLQNYEKHEYQIPMRDGKKLFTQVYTPIKKSVKYPIMFMHTPYGVAPYGEEKLAYRNVLGPSMLFTKEGFIFVYQDARGKYMSEGEFMQMRPLEPEGDETTAIDESTDMYDTIEWLLENTPNNGRVGMWGISYPGVYAAMALVNAHPALMAVSPQAPPSDWFMGDDWHHNGAFFWFQAVNWMRGSDYYRPELTDRFMGVLFAYPTPYLYDFFLDVGPVSNINTRYFKDRAPFWNYMMKHGTYDDFWKARSTLPHFKNIKSAVMNVGGWYDAENLYGTLKTYAAIEKQNPGIQNTLVMGPWYHGGWAWANSELLGDIRMNSASEAKYYRENVELAFFNKYLKDKGELNLPEALVFETGTYTWRSYDQWPPPNVTKQRLFFHDDETLSFSAPEETGDDAYEEYLSDPNKPVPHSPRTISGWSYDFMHDDQRFASRRPDVLVFKTTALKKDITMTGAITAELYVSTTGTDADWVVKLIDVYPSNSKRNEEDTWMGGYQMLVRGDVIRGKFRSSFEKPEPFKPGKITRVRFELQDLNHTFLKGHQIMVQVQSSWFPLVDRNPQKFLDIYSAKDDDFQKALHRIYRSKKYPSHIECNTVQQ